MSPSTRCDRMQARGVGRREPSTTSFPRRREPSSTSFPRRREPSTTSFPRRREPSHHAHSTGFPPPRERLIGVAHGGFRLGRLGMEPPHLTGSPNYILTAVLIASTRFQNENASTSSIAFAHRFAFSSLKPFLAPASAAPRGRTGTAQGNVLGSMVTRSSQAIPGRCPGLSNCSALRLIHAQEEHQTSQRRQVSRDPEMSLPQP